MVDTTDSGPVYTPRTRTSAHARRMAPLHIPFPLRCNSSVGHARTHTLDWLRSLGVLTEEAAAEEYDSLRLERLMAYFYPDAGVDDLDLAADVNAWFFVFDDQFDGLLGQQPDAVARLVGSMVGAMDDGAPAPRAPSPPLVEAFRDIWRRSTAGMPLFWQHRFREHWRDYLSAYHWEALNRTAPRAPTLDEFLRARRDSIGVQPCLDFAERCGGYALPPELHGAFPLADMRQITAEVVIFVNDIVSLDKELAAGDVNNCVLILRTGSDLTLEQAVLRIVDETHARITRFHELAAVLPAFLAAAEAPVAVREQAERYVEGMRHLMIGNLAWSRETARYDERGIAAVSEGRERPWARLTAAPAERVVSPRSPDPRETLERPLRRDTPSAG